MSIFKEKNLEVIKKNEDLMQSFYYQAAFNQKHSRTIST